MANGEETPDFGLVPARELASGPSADSASEAFDAEQLALKAEFVKGDSKAARLYYSL